MNDAVPVIAMRAVGKTYARGDGAVHALAGVDLDVPAGQAVALLGPSGSGKSTLLHLIGCLDTPTSGRYALAGDDVGGLDPAGLARRRRRIGFVFQAFHLMPRATTVENVALPLRYAGVPIGERRRRAVALLERVGLGQRLDHRPGELSGGQQQRVAVARALVNDPQLILADEPTGNLDSRSGADIMALLHELWREGRTLIVVTHDEALARRMQRVVRLLDGRIVSDQPAAANAG